MVSTLISREVMGLFRLRLCIRERFEREMHRKLFVRFRSFMPGSVVMARRPMPCIIFREVVMFSALLTMLQGFECSLFIDAMNRPGNFIRRMRRMVPFVLGMRMRVRLLPRRLEPRGGVVSSVVSFLLDFERFQEIELWLLVFTGMRWRRHVPRLLLLNEWCVEVSSWLMLRL